MSLERKEQRKIEMTIHLGSSPLGLDTLGFHKISLIPIKYFFLHFISCNQNNLDSKNLNFYTMKLRCIFSPNHPIIFKYKRHLGGERHLRVERQLYQKQKQKKCGINRS